VAPLTLRLISRFSSLAFAGFAFQLIFALVASAEPVFPPPWD